MKRRTLLSLTAAGVSSFSGCGSLKENKRLATATIHSQDTIDKKHGISVNANITDPAISTNKTATVEIHVENISGKDKIIADRYPSFIPTTNESTNPRLQLLPTNGAYPATSGTISTVIAKIEHALSSNTYIKSGRNCWVPKYPHAFEGRFVYRTLRPGEKFVNKYEVWGKDKADKRMCLPNGKFHFTTEYFTQSRETSTPKKISDWGFSIAVD